MSNPDNSDNNNTDLAMQIPIIPSRMRQLTSNLQSIQTRITAAVSASASASTATSSNNSTPRLVAVSKLKPASDILSLHRSSSVSHLHFGENYVQELVEKSRLLPRSIRWHFIGGLQSNKAAQLAREVPNLWAVESVDSLKKVGLLNKGRSEAETEETEKLLRVFVQVNTSGEESKSGVEPKSDELLEICRAVMDDTQSPYLRLQGLMTIGAIARSKAAANHNEDFEVLRECRDWVTNNLQIEERLELSMGMSEDFEAAIRQGSDEVRVGSTIFGERPPKSEARVILPEGEGEGEEQK